MSALHVDKVSKYFGGLAALSDVTFHVETGQRRAIIGPNGAGKTTLFNVISGQAPPSHGEVRLEGKKIASLPPHRRARLGIGRTFQRNNLFPTLSVFENVQLAVQRRRRVAWKPWRRMTRIGAVQTETTEVIESFNLEGWADTRADGLSYGVQRQVEVAVAAALRPRLLLLDEPTAGMSPAETAHMARVVSALPEEMTILIIEHDLDVLFSLVDSVTVLHYGQVIADGDPDEIKQNPRVQEVYLGEDGDHSADPFHLGA